MKTLLIIIRPAILTTAVLIVVSSTAMAMDFPGPDPGPATAKVEGDWLWLENQVIRASWKVAENRLWPADVRDKQVNVGVAPGKLLQITLADGRVISSADLRIVERPKAQRLAASPRVITGAGRHGGWQITVMLADRDGNLQVQWRAELRDGANYIRQFVTLQVREKELPVKNIRLVQLGTRSPAKARVVGSVAGSPVVLGNMFFAYEHPNSRSEVADTIPPDEAVNPLKQIRCSLDRDLPLKPGRPLTQSAVIGVAPPGQMRRAYRYYIERARPRAERPGVAEKTSSASGRGLIGRFCTTTPGTTSPGLIGRWTKSSAWG